MSKQSSSEEPLFRMIYVVYIDFITLFDYQYFNKLHQFSVKYNKKNNLSSVSCFSDGVFLSYAEGSEQDLTDLKNIVLQQKNLKQFKWIDFSQIQCHLLNKNSFKLFFANGYFFDNPFKAFLPFDNQQWDLQQSLTLVECMQIQNVSYSTKLTSKKNVMYLQLHWLLYLFFNHNFREHLLTIIYLLLLICLLVALITLTVLP